MKSIRFKLSVLFITIVTGILFTVYLFQGFLLPSFYQSAKTKQLEQLALKIEALLQNDPDRIQLDTISALSDEYEAIADIYWEDGTLSFTTTASSGRGMNMNPYMTRMQYLAFVEAFLQSGSSDTTQILMSGRANQRILFYALKIESGNVIVLTSPVTPLTSVLLILSQQLALILFWALGITIVLAFVVAGFLIKPIVNLSRAAHRVSEGQLNVKVFSKSNDELGQLTKDFNHMVTRLSEVEQEKSVVLANISHDLKTPLTMIQGYAQSALENGLADPEKLPHSLEIISSEAQRLGVLVNDILELTRLQTGGLKLALIHFDIVALIYSLASRYRLLFSDYDILVTPSQNEPMFVKADPHRIEQVLYNLIGNAINHAGESKSIIISLDNEPSFVRISVKDFGEGISESELPLIWNRYYTKQSSGRRLATGTGLGLSIVKELLVAHQTDFGVISDKGSGAEFWFTLSKV